MAGAAGVREREPGVHHVRRGALDVGAGAGGAVLGGGAGRAEDEGHLEGVAGAEGAAAGGRGVGEQVGVGVGLVLVLGDGQAQGGDAHAGVALDGVEHVEVRIGQALRAARVPVDIDERGGVLLGLAEGAGNGLHERGIVHRIAADGGGEELDLVAVGADKDGDAGGVAGLDGVDGALGEGEAVAYRAEHRADAEAPAGHGLSLRFDDGIGGDGEDFRGVRAVDSELLEEGVGELRRRLGRGCAAGAALEDGALEEAPGGAHREQRADGGGPCGFAEDRDVAGIASEGGDVVTHPAQGGDLVELAGVGGDVRRGKVLAKVEVAGAPSR